MNGETEDALTSLDSLIGPPQRSLILTVALPGPDFEAGPLNPNSPFPPPRASSASWFKVTRPLLRFTYSATCKIFHASIETSLRSTVSGALVQLSQWPHRVIASSSLVDHEDTLRLEDMEKYLFVWGRVYPSSQNTGTVVQKKPKLRWSGRLTWQSVFCDIAPGLVRSAPFRILVHEGSKPQQGGGEALALTFIVAARLTTGHLSYPHRILMAVIQHTVCIKTIPACTTGLLVKPIKRFL